MRKATRQHTKSHNSRLVLRTIYTADGVSRAEIARITGLTRPTVSALVAELMEGDLVLETGQGPSAGGKRPTLLNIAYDAHNLLCVDLGSQEFRGALVNLRGEIVARATFLRSDEQGDTAVTLAYQLIDTLLKQSHIPLLGIGIGTPGLVDPRNGIVMRAVNLGWHDLPLRDRVAARYDQPVYLANDSHSAALAEYTFGKQPDSENLVLVKVGQGIGAGIVLRGKAYFGDGFGAGEIGHVVVAESGERCSCGNAGCLETTSSTRAILRHAAAVTGNAAMSWHEVVQALESGDTAVTHVVETAGFFLGVAIANLIAAFNIHEIVISGRVTRLGAPFLQAVEAAARHRVLPEMAAQTAISYSELGTDIVLLGSSALVLQHELGVV